jgi:DNA-directed RNA polymerase specialized sigma24 family protein
VELTDRELQVITQGATNAYNAQRKFMDVGDLINEAVLWALTHEKKLLMWLEKGKHGENLLRFSAKQHCLSLIGKERRRIYVLEKDDIAYYTPAIVREVLPDIFDIDDWLSGSTNDQERVSGTSRPSEGNTRLATVVDVKSGFDSLSVDDKALLTDLYADGGVTHQVLAATLEVAEKTIQRREQRAVQRLVDKLGGELPWWDMKGRSA